MMIRILLLLLISIATPNVSAFLPANTPKHQWRLAFGMKQNVDETALSEIRSMSIQDIKKELAALQISSKDAFEKEELVRRLYEARQTKHDSADNKCIQTPLYFANMDRDIRVAAVHGAGPTDVTINPSDQPYATIQIQVHDSKDDYTLSLLLDTACSGFVLRPEICKKYNMPSLKTPVKMTGAGGTESATGLTQINKFSLGGETYGPLPAAVQDIGALPNSLDGIIGLSFMNQFAEVEMDFQKGVVSFFRDTPRPRSDLQVIAKTSMNMLPRLGIYTAEVTLGDRGPVQMLVDSGASSTFLSWKGVSDLGLKRDSNFIAPLQSPVGAVGSDNVATQLTHRLNVSSKLNLGLSTTYTGLSLAGAARLSIDIGQIPILEGLQGQGVGGILGVDVMMRCAAVRFSFRGPLTMTFLNRDE